VKAGALVQKLGSVEVEVAECGEDEASWGDLNNVRKVLAIVRAEAGDETVTVDFCVNKGFRWGGESGEIVIADQ